MRILLLLLLLLLYKRCPVSRGGKFNQSRGDGLREVTRSEDERRYGVNKNGKEACGRSGAKGGGRGEEAVLTGRWKARWQRASLGRR
eukprot:757153-Hanusia_phi.AAC.9